MASVSVPFLSPRVLDNTEDFDELVPFDTFPGQYANMNEISYARNMDVDTSPDAAGEIDGKSAVRSCTTCSKAKAKCVKQPGQRICERCARLNKDCHSREPAMRRRKVVKATRAAQLEKLEGKIEHLVNALSKSQSQKALSSIDYGQPSPPISSTSERSERPARPSSHELLNAVCGDECDRPAGTLPHAPGITTPPTHPTPSATMTHTSLDDPCNLGVSMSGAEILLDRYRRLMAHSNPFVIIPADATAQSLNEKRPFLLHAIVTVTYFHDLPRQQAMVKQMMRDVSERMLLNGEKSLDIVQGIITFVSWYHPHIFWAQQVTNLLHLAIAMSVELGIDRRTNQCGDFKGQTVKAIHTQTTSRIATLEEHRTLAGVFYLTGMLASSFKKMDAMPHTKYLDESMSILEQAAEYESDMLVVQMIRLQHLIQETYTMEMTDVPAHMYVRAFKADLDLLRKNDPCKDSENVFLKMQYLTAEILVYELSLIDLQDNHAKPLSAHLKDLYNCVESIRRFIDVYFTIPSSVYLTIPFSTFGQFAHAFIVLVKLASLEVEGWDLKDMQDRLDFVNVIDEVTARFDASTKSSPDGLVVINESFGKWASRMRWMKQVFEAKFSQDGRESADVEDRGKTTFKALTLKPPNHPTYPLPQQPAVQGVQQPTPPDDVLSGDFFNYLDEGFWNSFGTDFDLGFSDMSMNAMGLPMGFGQAG